MANLTFTFGAQGSSQDPGGRWDDTFVVDSQGNLINQNTGKAVATYNASTGELRGINDGHYMGQIVIGADGQATYTTEKGNVIPGGYTGEQSPGSSFNLPDVAGVEGPWSTSQSQGTSYSGMGPEYASTIAGWMAQLQESMSPEAYQALISDAYGSAQQQVGQAYQEAQNYLPEIYQQNLKPALQGAINQLAAKNMINSTTGGGALAGAANLAYQSILPQQANLAGQQAGMLGQLAGQEAAYQTAYPVTLGGILSNLGRHTTQTSGSSSESRNPLAPYQLLYSTLPAMAQYGNPAALPANASGGGPGSNTSPAISPYEFGNLYY